MRWNHSRKIRDIEQVAKMVQHPIARQCAMLVTDTLYDYIAEPQLFETLQVRGQWRLSPGRIKTKSLVTEVRSAQLRAKVTPDMQFRSDAEGIRCSNGFHPSTGHSLGRC